MPDAVLDAAKRLLSSFVKPGRILVAVSGGSDSMGLLFALHSAIAEEKNDFSLAACSVDHALRSGSAAEAEAVGRFCSKLGIPHSILRWEGNKPRTGIQAAARNKRYELLAVAANAFDADCIATGHTADDQCETIAMRGARHPVEGETGEGQGAAGMAATMLYARQIWVLRPFLGIRRAEIRTFLETRGIGWSDDPSNVDPQFERARLRADVDRSNCAPTPVWSGAQRAASSARAAALIEERVKLYETLVAEIAASSAGKMDNPDWRRGLLSVAAILGGRDHLPARATIKRLSDFLRSDRPGRMTAGRVVFDRRRSGLYLYREPRNLPVLGIGPGCRGLWDGRFSITSRGPALTVSAGADGAALEQRLIDAGLPKGVARRASEVAPRIVFAEAGSSGGEAAVIECRIGLYDTFLPGFDRIMADAVAVLFGRERYPAPPVHDV
ncbi:tRNA lysidine(34) synthetase TilS [Ensifer sp. LCM 4579]|uniref:tRNA lysidine(34) synthetase TilS n=1 Tax=Ensifer sp. LCM 4579 TaxID=1848292 RepID=UPI0008D97932|nr:tRNA lysidine(34) synthetase TilS [Ensifer sp. LCM 4579]OHV75382.1 tRNA lysidine(34) synthetase TilS [Ensifer sp. LCM 4579]